jgi:hypothetical protein
MKNILSKIQAIWEQFRQREDYRQAKKSFDLLATVYENKPQLLNCIEAYQDAVAVANRFDVKITDTKIGLLIHLYSEDRLHNEVSRNVVEIIIKAKPRRLKLFNIMKEFGDIPVLQCLSDKVEKENNWLREQ